MSADDLDAPHVDTGPIAQRIGAPGVECLDLVDVQEAQTVQELDQERLQSARGTVVDLQGEAAVRAGHADDVRGFRSDLREELAAARAQQVRAQPVLRTRDELGVRGGGRRQAFARCAARRFQVVGIGDARDPCRQAYERQPERRRAAAVDRDLELTGPDAAGLLHGCSHRALRTTLRVEVADRVVAQMDAQSEKACVLPRAVVVQRGGLHTLPPQGPGRGTARGPMGTALQTLGAKPQASEHALDDRHVDRLAVVGGDRQGQLLGAEAEAIGCATLDQRQGLDGLRRAPSEDGTLERAGAVDAAPVTVDQHPSTAMLGLDRMAAPHAGQNRIVGEVGHGARGL